ncbi:hypothetical protein LEP1GSC173_1292 [Leptospira interrogans str. HAI1594]|uniref:Uncharacterized protein n=1 Tax=Leptospira interrogans serovar Hardjo str. Norma TaxID=1279460 RepID=A0A0M5L7M9_LEPIR|nr:hypothetical protein G436_1833 [Leptospira interrogans serovar Hardjo str. Norma]EKP75797.1 hypothetical protein LEP1GSC173_1292 [Leptospira interrogans str. HAI1594]
MRVLQLNLEMWELTQFAGFTVKFRNVGTHTKIRIRHNF